MHSCHSAQSDSSRVIARISRRMRILVASIEGCLLRHSVLWDSISVAADNGAEAGKFNANLDLTPRGYDYIEMEKYGDSRDRLGIR